MSPHSQIFRQYCFHIKETHEIFFPIKMKKNVGRTEENHEIISDEIADTIVNI